MIALSTVGELRGDACNSPRLGFLSGDSYIRLPACLPMVPLLLDEAGSGFGSGLEAFRWTREGGMVGLGVLPNKVGSAAMNVSADASTIWAGVTQHRVRTIIVGHRAAGWSTWVEARTHWPPVCLQTVRNRGVRQL